MSRRSAAYCVLAIALAWAAYANALRGSFTFDDQHEVVENTSIADLRQPGLVVRGAVSRPLTNAFYAVDYAVWGGRDPFGFHLTKSSTLQRRERKERRLVLRSRKDEE
jgi:hypothetical protein